MADEKKRKELNAKIDKYILQDKIENKKDTTEYYTIPTDYGTKLQEERPGELSQTHSTATLSYPGPLMAPKSKSDEYHSKKKKKLTMKSLPPTKNKNLNILDKKEKNEMTDKLAYVILQDFQMKEDGLKKDILRSLNLMKILDQQSHTLMYLMEEPFAMWLTGYSSSSSTLIEDEKDENKSSTDVTKKEIEDAFGKTSDALDDNKILELDDSVKSELDDIIDTAEKVTKSMSSVNVDKKKNQIHKYALEDLTLERVEKALYHIRRRILMLSLRKREISRNMLDRVTDAYIRLQKSTMSLKERYPSTIPNSNPCADIDEDIESLLDPHTLNQIYKLSEEIMENSLDLDYLNLDENEIKEFKKLEETLKKSPEDILNTIEIPQGDPDSPKTVIKQLKQCRLPGLFNDTEIEPDVKDNTIFVEKPFKEAIQNPIPLNINKNTAINKRNYVEDSEFSPGKNINENVKTRKYNTTEGKKHTEMSMDPILLNAVMNYQPVHLNNEGKMFLDVVDTLYGKMIQPPKGYTHSSKSPQAEGNVLKLDGISNDLVGLSAEIYWPDDGLWYFVHINSLDIEKKKANIIYTTGETEILDLIDIVKEGHMLIID